MSAPTIILVPPPRDWRRWRRGALVLGGISLAMLALAAPDLGLRAASAPGPSRFVFVQSLDGGFTYHVHTSSPIGTNRRRVSSRRAIGRPTVSPDGQKIAFSGPLRDDSDGRYALYVTGLHGEAQRRITAPTYGDFDPAWSPDGRLIAFTRNTRGNISATCCLLGVISTDGRRRTRLIAHTNTAANPAWSPDSRKLAFGAHDGIRVVGVDGSNPRLIVRGSASQPAWSPNGSRIAFVQRVSNTRSRIVTVAAAGGSARLVENMAGQVESPVWSPDGSALYFVYYHGLGDEGRTDSAVWRASGGKVTRLFRYKANLYGLTHWGPH